MILSQLPYLRLRPTFVVDQTGFWPGFSGSMLRGIFGRSLKKVFCTIPHGNCSICIQNQTCSYVKFFEDESMDKVHEGFQKKPRPYVFSKLPLGREYEKGEIIQFDLNLMGDAIVSALYFTTAIQWMEQFPLMGSHLKISFHSMEYIDRPNPQVPPNPKILETSFLESILNHHGLALESTELTMYLTTPMRLVYQGKEIKRLSSDALLFHLKNRFKIVHENFGTFDPKDIESGGELEIEKIEEKLTHKKRYSFRQKKEYKAPGIVGTYKLKVNQENLRRLLWMGSYYHLGKNTTFGFGEYELNAGEIK